MPTPIQIEAERLLAEERKKRGSVVAGMKDISKAAKIFGTLAGSPAVGTLAGLVWDGIGSLANKPSEYESELEKVIRGERRRGSVFN